MNLRVRSVTGCSLSAMLPYVIEGSESLPTMNVSRQMSEWWLSMKDTVDWSRAASKFKLEMKRIRLNQNGPN
jgi:predicted ATP-grasp superfamily ATP-dependent carboligase